MDNAEQYWQTLSREFGSWGKRCLELENFQRYSQGLYPKPHVNHPLQVFHRIGRGAYGYVQKVSLYFQAF